MAKTLGPGDVRHKPPINSNRAAVLPRSLPVLALPSKPAPSTVITGPPAPAAETETPPSHPAGTRAGLPLAPASLEHRRGSATRGAAPPGTHPPRRSAARARGNCGAPGGFPQPRGSDKQEVSRFCGYCPGRNTPAPVREYLDCTCGGSGR